MDSPRYSMRPSLAPRESLEDLCKRTKFSKREIQVMYRSFKQECPTGYVDEETFKNIFAQFFPYGTGSYAHYVFKTFDRNRNNCISFKDFIVWLSLVSRGSIQEKLKWAFKLYDINKDGKVTRKELTEILCSIYALLGRRPTSVGPSEDEQLTQHVDRIFQKLDLNKDGVVSLDEFMEVCTKDEQIAQSLAILDTVI